MAILDGPELNVGLLDRTMAEIKAHPERHRQKSWRADYDAPSLALGLAAHIDGPSSDREAYRVYPERTDEIKVDYIREPIPVMPDTCGTAYCFAGMAIHLTGLRWMSQDAVVIPSRENAPSGAWVYNIPVTGGAGTREVLCMYPSSEAMELLGLTDDEATVLFQESNTIDDLEVIVRQIKEGVSRGDNNDWFDSWARDC